jgi:TRAP-type C4-dicarboxylate transport system permease small subunit
VFCRSVLGFSLLITEELGSYLLVALVFLGMGSALHAGALFRVEFIIHSLPERGRQVVQLVFDLLSLAFAALLSWQMLVLVQGSYERHVQAGTTLATPLYIPQIVMVVGSATLALVLVSQCLARVLALFGKAS